MKTLKQFLKSVKVNNNDTKAKMSLISVIDFEQVNAGFDSQGSFEYFWTLVLGWLQNNTRVIGNISNSNPHKHNKSNCTY